MLLAGNEAVQLLAQRILALQAQLDSVRGTTGTCGHDEPLLPIAEPGSPAALFLSHQPPVAAMPVHAQVEAVVGVGEARAMPSEAAGTGAEGRAAGEEERTAIHTVPQSLLEKPVSMSGSLGLNGGVADASAPKADKKSNEWGHQNGEFCHLEPNRNGGVRDVLPVENGADPTPAQRLARLREGDSRGSKFSPPRKSEAASGPMTPSQKLQRLLDSKGGGSGIVRQLAPPAPTEAKDQALEATESETAAALLLSARRGSPKFTYL